MKRVLLVASFAIAAASGTVMPARAMPSNLSPAAARANLIVPGKSVGKVSLGLSRVKVRAILGNPTASFIRAADTYVDEWLGAPLGPKGSWNEALPKRLAVIYRGGRAVQIEVNSPTFRTASGISTKSTLAQFRSSYRPTLRSYLHLDEGGGGYRAYFYDDVKRGIAFTFGGQDNYDSRVTAEMIRIHRPGYTAIADPGGKLFKTNDEIPVARNSN